MLMIVTYSGFWILYFQNFGSCCGTSRFIDGAPVSAAMTSLLGRSASTCSSVRRRTRHVINAGTIILCRCSSAASSRRTGAADDGHGHAHRGIGFLLLASRTTVVFVAGIAVFSIAR